MLPAWDFNIKSENRKSDLRPPPQIFRWHWRKEPGKLPPYEIQNSYAK